MVNESVNEFRLQYVREMQKIMENERRNQSDLQKSYKKSIRIMTGFNDAMTALAIVLGLIGIALLASAAVTYSVIIDIEGTALTAVVLRVMGDQVNKRLSKEVEKHKKIKIYAECTLRFISIALNDGQISDEEYSLIWRGLDEYRKIIETITPIF